MKKPPLITALLGAGLSATAQTAVPTPAQAWAVGVEAGSYLAGTAPAQARLRVQPGLFARYQPGRLGGRAGLAFGQWTTNPNPPNCADCLVGITTSHTLGMRLGAQYAPLPKLPWLYTFLDVAYHRTRTEGHYTGGFCGCLDNTDTETTRTAGAAVGIGTSFRMVSRLYVGSELYYEGFMGRSSRLSTDNHFGGQTNSSGPARGHAPAIRLQAAVAF